MYQVIDYISFKNVSSLINFISEYGNLFILQILNEANILFLRLLIFVW